MLAQLQCLNCGITRLVLKINDGNDFRSLLLIDPFSAVAVEPNCRS
jgi:hypothetical protein